MAPTPKYALLGILLQAGTLGTLHGASAQTAEDILPDSPKAAVASLRAVDIHPSDSAEAGGSVADLPDAPTPQTASIETQHWPVERETTWGSLVPDILHDQKEIWLSPLQLSRGRGWVPTVVIAAGTAGFIASDSHTMPYFRDHQPSLDDLNDVFDQWITMGEIAAVPVGLMVAGTVRNDSYQKTTALLAARAYADSEVLEFAAKLVTRRERPSDVPPGQSFNHTFFKSQLVSGNGSSFPSGHAAGAFCVATAVSTRYKNHRWVPWVMYSAATAISLSRVTTLAHFPSDVFLGAAMGYSVSRFEVLRPR